MPAGLCQALGCRGSPGSEPLSHTPGHSCLAKAPSEPPGCPAGALPRGQWLLWAGRCSGEWGRARCWVRLSRNDSPRNVNERQYFFSPGCPCALCCLVLLILKDRVSLHLLDYSLAVFKSTEFQNAFPSRGFSHSRCLVLCLIQQDPQGRLDVKQGQVWEGRLAAAPADRPRTAWLPLWHSTGLHTCPPPPSAATVTCCLL